MSLIITGRKIGIICFSYLAAFSSLQAFSFDHLNPIDIYLDSLPCPSSLIIDGDTLYSGIYQASDSICLINTYIPTGETLIIRAPIIKILPSTIIEIGSSVLMNTGACVIPCSLSNLKAEVDSPDITFVQVQNFVFSPKDITINQGDTVEWQWTTSISHTSTSDATSGPDSWDSGLLNQPSTFRAPILNEGFHRYYCIPHGGPGGTGMSGTITVDSLCSNGMKDFTVTFDEEGGSATGYNVLIDDTLVTSGVYHASGTNSIHVSIAGDGAMHLIEIEDEDDPSCSISISVFAENCDG